MRVILVLSVFFAVAFAGVGRLNREQEEEIISLYRSICTHQREGGLHGGTSVYCKSPIDAPKEIHGEHELRVDSPGTSHSQVVFVRPQSNIYKHSITLTGTSQHERNTTIFVLPKKDDHQIDIVDERVSITKGDKPHLYYLNKDPLENQQIPQEGSDSVVGAPPGKPLRRPSERVSATIRRV